MASMSCFVHVSGHPPTLTLALTLAVTCTYSSFAPSQGEHAHWATTCTEKVKAGGFANLGGMSQLRVEADTSHPHSNSPGSHVQHLQRLLAHAAL